jgi:hypothetical protein
MPRKIISNSDVVLVFLILIFIVVLTGCNTKIGKGEFEPFPGTSKIILTPDSNLMKNIHIVPPPSTLDTQKRVLTGTHKDFVFDHPGFDSKNRWCYYCHYTESFDLLKLETNKLIGYQKSYELCVQCHVTKYADWEVGMHGQRTGEWNGKKQYQSCIFCHNPHTPKFKPIESMKPPLKPTKYLKIDE